MCQPQPRGGVSYNKDDDNDEDNVEQGALCVYVGLVESERKARAEMSGMLVRLSVHPKGPFGSSGFETGPAKSTSQFGKSAVFEIRTFDLAGQAPFLVPNRPKGLIACAPFRSALKTRQMCYGDTGVHEPFSRSIPIREKNDSNEGRKTPPRCSAGLGPGQG